MSRNGYKNKQRSGPYPLGPRDRGERRSGPPHSSSNEDISSSAPSSMSHGGSGSSMSNEMNRMTEVSPKRGFERNRQEKKFANRARLYVGNLPRGISEDELKILFDPYGEMTQVFIEKDKNFGFVRMVSLTLHVLHTTCTCTCTCTEGLLTCTLVVIIFFISS